jgi:hypothetical protein
MASAAFSTFSSVPVALASGVATDTFIPAFFLVVMRVS